MLSFRGRLLHLSPRGARALTSLLLALPAALVSNGASAQTKVEARFSAERFQAEMGPRNYLVTAGARTDGQKTWSFGVLAHYGYKPFVVRSCVRDTAPRLSASLARRARRCVSPAAIPNLS